MMVKHGMQRVTALLLCVLFCSVPLAALAAPPALISWVATEQVSVGSKFAGTRILVLGGMSQPGQIIVALRSPMQTAFLKVKKRKGPFWLGSGKVTVTGAPGVFQLLSSAPRHEQLSAATLEQENISLSSVLHDAKFEPSPDRLDKWQDAFLHLKEGQGDYVDNDHAVTVIDGHVFLTKIVLPTAIPLGTYRVDVFLTRNGHIVAHQTHDFSVREVSLERWVTRVAVDHAWLFGVVFVPLVGVFGLAIGLTLRRITS